MCRVVKAATRAAGTSYVAMLAVEDNAAELLGPVTTYVMVVLLNQAHYF